MSSSERTRRVALVTGAARGIGRATTARLIRSGYAVVAFDCCSGHEVPTGVTYPLATRADLDEVVRAHPSSVLPIVGDVRNRHDLVTAVEASMDRFGRLDAVVAGAGVVIGGTSGWELPSQDLQTLLDINVTGVWNTASATVPTLLNNPTTARFVAIASTAGEHGLRHLAAYSASKHAVIGIVRGLAADLVGTGATAVAVAPGSTDTAILHATAALYGVSADELAGHQAIRRLLSPDEVAMVIEMCCSPLTAALNGSVVRADGGFGL